MKKGVTWCIPINGGTIEGLFNDVVIGDVVHGNKTGNTGV